MKMKLELARNAARDNKNRIIPRHVILAVRNDDELGKLLAGVTIAHGEKSVQEAVTELAAIYDGREWETDKGIYIV